MHPSQAVIGHPTCDMELQRRIHASRRDAVANAVRRRRGSGKRTLLDRILRREGSDTAHLDADALRDHAEDVWHSLRI